MPCTTIKGQVLVDLVEKFTKYLGEVDAEKGESVGVQVTTIAFLRHSIWKLYVDGAAN